MPHLLGLIFDLEGTLIDSAPDYRNALNIILREHGRRELTAAEVSAMMTDGVLQLMTSAFEATGGMPEGQDSYSCFQKFIGYYRTMPPDPAQILPYIQETIETYAAKGLKLGICTNAQQATSDNLLTQLGLRKYFGFIGGGDTFAVHKPNPDHVRGVMSALKLWKGSCAMVGDTYRDALAAHGAEIPFIGVTHGEPADERMQADKLIREMNELPDALAGLGFEIKK